MAKGFATGLVQGAVVSAAALAVLSLAAPQPEAPARGSETDAPAAETLALPTGSEFGRGTDEAPHMPEPLSRPDTQALGDAPAVMAPAAEPVPTPTTATAARPETRDLDPEAPSEIAPVEEAGEMPEAPSAEARVPVAVPGRVETPTPDRKPEQVSAESDRPPESATAQEAPTEPEGVASMEQAPAGEDLPARAAAPEQPKPTAPETAPETAGARGEVQPAPPVDAGAHSDTAPADPVPMTESPARPVAAQPDANRTDAPALGLDLSVPPDLGGLTHSN